MIDDFLFEVPLSNLHTEWRAVTDQVMGGLSKARLKRGCRGGKGCQTLTAQVSTANNGGFAQMTLDFAPQGGTFDARGFKGLSLVVRGNGEEYGVHLKTADISRPWQSYRANFHATRSWQEIMLPWSAFQRHRIDTPLNVGVLRRLGIVAIGRPFKAEVSLARLTLKG
ncbi:MAG: CIA30 family protein [Magnetovibrionaceae bacterium]